MIDWNNNGKIDLDDIILTEVILDEEAENDGQDGQVPEQGDVQGDHVPGGTGAAGCLASMLVMLLVPAGIVLLLLL